METPRLIQSYGEVLQNFPWVNLPETTWIQSGPNAHSTQSFGFLFNFNQLLSPFDLRAIAPYTPHSQNSI